MNYISQAFIDTLGTMTFIDAILSPKPTEATVEHIGHRLTILRPFAEEVFVFFPKKLVAQMVENMFGEQENIHSPQVIEDCVAEFLNVFAGKYFQLVAPDKLFELGLPKQAKIEEVSDDYQKAFFETERGDTVTVYHKL